jgi:hypothetical protein
MLRSLMRHPELKLFAGAYLLYNAGRWLTAGDMDPAVANAEWIVRTEETLGVAIERSVQDGLQGGLSMWVLSHLYLAAWPPSSSCCLPRSSSSTSGRRRSTGRCATPCCSRG